MPKIKFIHTADLHIDTPFKGLSNLNEELAKRLKDATFNTFRSIVELCIQENVDFLLIAGDIFDSEIKSLSAQLRFYNEIVKLSDKGISTYFICGNHDPLSSWINTFNWPENVHRFGSKKVECLTYTRNGEKLADIYGISFHNKVVKENLSLKYKRISNDVPFAIGLLHANVGSSPAHDNYAPCTKDDLLKAKLDYWALGHIHKSEKINKAYPTIIYSGNPQGRDFSETGAHGCFLIEMQDNKPPLIKFKALQKIQFYESEIDMTNVKNVEIVIEKINNLKNNLLSQKPNCSYIIRIKLIGRTELYNQLNEQDELKEIIEIINENELDKTFFCWIDNIQSNLKPDIDLNEREKANDFVAEVLKNYKNIQNDNDKMNELFHNVEAELKKGKAKHYLNDIQEKDLKDITESSKLILLNQLIQE